MLFFIGGAARTGKGIISRRLLYEQHIPYMSVDVLKMGLARGVPEFAIDPDAGAFHVAERTWPLVREMCRNLIAEQVPYLIEGELLPQQIALYRNEYPSQVHGCFLGYSTITPAQKCHEIRTNGGHPNDWPSEVSDAALLAIIEREIAFSRFLQAECQTYQLPYFDSSQAFLETIDQVVALFKSVLIQYQ